ncbi:IMP dehydrogenase [Candidatus Saccharibacteria bacterium]|nr:IMP dehydrogenase [Candidatus Saccharibacteria bacterium]
MVIDTVGLTFDDVLLKPGYAGFLRSEINLKSRLTKKIELSAPLLAAPMDTVTESKLAIALAQCGGFGFIHRNLKIEDQAAEVAKVKAAGLPVGAAVGSRPGYEKRVAALVAAGADVILVDSAHGYSKQVISAVQEIKKRFVGMEVIGGNVATAEGAKALIDAGVDGLRVGMGPGAICSTRIISGMGVPQLTALGETSIIAAKAGVPIIADGGIKYSGDITKALAAGASSVMLGRIFAATLEAPGQKIELKKDEVPARFQSIFNGADTYTFKSYHGMGSISAMKKGIEVSSEDEFHGKSYSGETLIAEGVEGLVPSTGPLKETVDKLLGGVVSGMYYVGAKTVPELWSKAQFMQITQASLTESHPHNLFITDTGGNLG